MSHFDGFSNLTRIEGKRSLNKLQGYLKIKGILLRRKIAPSGDAFVSGGVDAEFMSNFVSNTELSTYRFWHSLSKEKKESAFRYMSLRENVPNRVISVGIRKKADIFIVISGTGTEKNSKTGEVREIKIGSVIGAVDVFEHYANKDYEDPEEPVTYISHLKRGCLVRLRLIDFMMSQFGPSIDEEEVYLSSLRPEERLIYETRKLATKSISPGLYDILDANDLLPVDPNDTSFQYLCKGNINRKIEIHRGEPASIIILLSGTIQVMLKRHIKSIFALKNDDDSETIAVKINGTPLVSIEAGTLVYIDDHCFSPPAIRDTSSDASIASLSDSTIKTSSTAADAYKHSPMTRQFSSNTMQSNNDMETLPPMPLAVENNDSVPPLFHLELLFKSTCNYIRIPKSELKQALKSEDYSTTAEIVKQLNVVNQSIQSRISELNVWSSANIAINLAEQEHVPGSTWGIEKKEVITSSMSDSSRPNNLYGTYRLPVSVMENESCSKDQFDEDQEAREADIATTASLAAMLAAKTKSATVFSNTALDDDAKE